MRRLLGVKKDKEMDTIDGDGPKRNAKSIEVKNVRYVSDKDLVNGVNLRCKITWLISLIPLFVWQIMQS